MTVFSLWVFGDYARTILVPLIPDFFGGFSGHAGEFFQSISGFRIDLPLDFPKFSQDGVGGAQGACRVGVDHFMISSNSSGVVRSGGQ